MPLIGLYMAYFWVETYGWANTQTQLKSVISMRRTYENNLPILIRLNNQSLFLRSTALGTMNKQKLQQLLMLRDVKIQKMTNEKNRKTNCRKHGNAKLNVIVLYLPLELPSK